METLRKIIEEKKRKGEEKKPYYGIRKLSVGIVSCMLGHLLFFASPVVVNSRCSWRTTRTDHDKICL